jgi:hypothetical protein
MLEKLLDNRSLGTKSQIYQVISTIKSGCISLEELKETCTHKQYSFSLNFHGIISLLLWLKIINSNDGDICLNSNYDLNDSSSGFLYLVFKKLAVENQLHLFLNSDIVQFEDKPSTFLINNQLLPLNFSPLRNLMINFNLFEKDNILYNFYKVNDNLIDFFKNKVLPLVDESRIKNNPQSNIQVSLDKKAELGRIAEEFVVNFERKCMAKHPNNNNIRMISDEDCGAGYDILSYQTESSIFLDKYIEVKSYSGEPYFYWSINEVKVSEKEKNNYFLYLVNRDEMNDIDYSPIMIQNPFESVFDNEEWSKEPQSWKFELKDDA